jgi:hypothetical protein
MDRGDTAVSPRPADQRVIVDRPMKALLLAATLIATPVAAQTVASSR